jgi:hypothetical protein
LILFIYRLNSNIPEPAHNKERGITGIEKRIEEAKGNSDRENK